MSKVVTSASLKNRRRMQMFLLMVCNVVVSFGSIVYDAILYARSELCDHINVLSLCALWLTLLQSVNHIVAIIFEHVIGQLLSVWVYSFVFYSISCPSKSDTTIPLFEDSSSGEKSSSRNFSLRKRVSIWGVSFISLSLIVLPNDFLSRSAPELDVGSF
jgi:hypothetical protein